LRPLLMLSLLFLWAPDLRADGALRLEITHPLPGSRVENRAERAFVSGTAATFGGRQALFDVVLVVDISQSTGIASGSDIDSDGEVGVNPHQALPRGVIDRRVLSTDPDDSVLNAEVAAGHALLQTLDPRRVRIGFVSFSGEFHPQTGQRLRPDQEDAWLEVPITGDYLEVDTALRRAVARGPRGATNFAAGIRLAVRELTGLPGARSRPRPDAKKVILFLTDGVPTFPIGRASVPDPGDKEAALLAARLAARAGITINSYAIGPGALGYPEAVTELARTTGGVYTPVQSPGDIVALLREVSFVDIEDVVLSNLTTGDFSTDVRLQPDGTFQGFVSVREGINRLRVTALASDGSRTSREVEVEYGISNLTDRDIALELERIRDANRELTLEREREEVERFRRHQRKQLEIDVEANRPEGSGVQ